MKKFASRALLFCLPAAAVALALGGYSIISPGEQIAAPVIARVCTNEESDLLARFVTAEAGGKSYIVKTSVAAVIFNRAESGYFPKGLCYIICTDESFDSVKSGALANEADEASVRAVRDAMSGVDPTDGALYFFKSGNIPEGYSVLCEYEDYYFCN